MAIGAGDGRTGALPHAPSTIADAIPIPEHSPIRVRILIHDFDPNGGPAGGTDLDADVGVFETRASRLTARAAP